MVTRTRGLSSQAYLIASGSKEHPGNPTLARVDAEWLREAGAFTINHTYDGMDPSFPPRFYDSLAIWTQAILELRARSW
jgi:hypothetical protein